MVRRIITIIVPWVLASTVGVLVLVSFFVRMPGLEPLFNGLIEWASIIAAFALLLGLVNVARTHGERVARQESGWVYSLVLLLSAVAIIFVGLLPPRLGPADSRVQWIFQHVIEPLALSFFSLLAFFLASAFFRALRLRNLEALLVTVAAVIVLLGQVPSTPLLSMERVVEVKDWLLRVPAAAGVRALLIGAAVGSVATAMRVILGLERPYAE